MKIPMDLPEVDARVLIFAPIGRDGAAAMAFLQRVGLQSEICRGLSSLLVAIRHGAATVLIAEEGLFGKDLSELSHWVASQPPWSDLPFVILTSRQEQPAVAGWRLKLVDNLRNVSLLERPLQTITLTSTVRAAVRARARQYEIRRLLEARQRAAEELEAMVRVRTAELAAANEDLRTQMMERARVEEAFRQAQKIEALGQLTGGVAHDFNNLLMVISGGLEVLERQDDPVRRRRLLDRMQQAAQRGAGLTRQLLAFSRRQELKPEPVDLRLQVGGMRELLDRSLRGDVHVALEFADDLWPVEVDPGELELVVLNLAVNARDAMPNGGTIKIIGENVEGFADGELAGDYLRLSVVDSGTGMSEAVKAHVFEPFFTTKEIGRGSGLGLAQVHGFAKQSGGTVEVDSRLGRGTTISILLPRSGKSPPRVESRPVDPQVGPARPDAAGSVLLVEDDDEVAALVTEMLGQLGYRAFRTASASAALGALSNGRPVDLVFSDVMMPGGMSGVELAREIRIRRRTLPVLLTSGYAEVAKETAEAEGVRVLRKPFGLDELAAALRGAMAPGKRQPVSTERRCD
jgi:signal transduction histidine kinase/CheY-like chemotaxis protein